MIKFDQTTLERLEERYPGFIKQLHSFESVNLPACKSCRAQDTASVQVGIIGRTINLAAATTKFKLIPNGPKPGPYFCNQCKAFFDSSDL